MCEGFLDVFTVFPKDLLVFALEFHLCFSMLRYDLINRILTDVLPSPSPQFLYLPFPINVNCPSLTGDLRHISKLRFWPLHSVLSDKYLFPSPAAMDLAGFLNPMLCCSPEKRAGAREVLWFGCGFGNNVAGGGRLTLLNQLIVN